MRFALRSLTRHPGFTAVGALTIALAVAGNTTIFAVLKALVLDPLPFRKPQELVTLDVRSTRGFLVSISIPNYRDWGASRAFRTVGASAPWGMILTGRDQAQVVGLRAVLGDFFGTLGATAYRGRLFTPAETEPGAEATVVLGYGFWRSQFGGDVGILGQSLLLDRRPYVVVGILPDGFGYPSPEVDAYVPMGSIPRLPWEDRQSGFGTRMIARLAPGTTPTLAQRDLDGITAGIEAELGRASEHPELRTLADFYIHDLQRQAWVLMGAVGFVLLIAVANVGGLVLARGEDRRREIAVRAAMGAGRRQLAGLLLSESLVLAFLGGALGLALSYAAVRTLPPFLPGEIPSLLIGAGLMLESLRNLRAVDKGFDDNGVLTARLSVPVQKYATKDRWRAFHDELLPRIRALPGVRAVAVSLLLPLTDRSWGMGILPENVATPRGPSRCSTTT